jgi:hypothetical protein
MLVLFSQSISVFCNEATSGMLSSNTFHFFPCSNLSSASSLFVLIDKLVFHTLALVICGISPYARLVRNKVKETMDGCFRLSLSTTFGGSPVTALSPFCLLVANVNTLMAQFLFVFLSGAGESPTVP